MRSVYDFHRRDDNSQMHASQGRNVFAQSHGHFLAHIKWTRIAVVSLWSLLVLVTGFYAPISNDEGPFHYQAAYIAAGHMPVLDFYATHSIWTYLPFAAIIKLISPQIESMRLLTTALYVAEVVALSRLAEKKWGREFFWYCFVLFGFSWFWFATNFEVNHSAPANAGLIFSLIALSGIARARMPLAKIFMAGLCVSIAVNARSPLFPLIAIYFFYLFSIRRDLAASFPRVLLIFCLGLIIPAAPNFYILAHDFDALLFDYLTSHLQLQLVTADAGSVIVERLLAPLRVLLVPDWGYFGSTVFASLPLAIGLAAATTSGGRALWRSLWNDRDIRLSLLLIVGIIACYDVADSVKSKYFNHIIPFTVLCLLAVTWELRLRPVFGRAMVVLTRVAAAASAMVFLASAGADILKRDFSARSRPLAIIRIACWLESNTSADAVVMSYGASPVAISGRRLPRGLEQAGGLVPISWIYSSPEQAERYHMLSYAGFERMLAANEVDVFLDDSAGFGLPKPYLAQHFPSLEGLLAAHYQPWGMTGGADSYDVHVAKGVLQRQRVDPLPVLPPNPFHDAAFANAVATRDASAVAKMLATETVQSLARLPGDLGRSFRRAAGAPYDQRCAQAR